MAATKTYGRFYDGRMQSPRPREEECGLAACPFHEDGKCTHETCVMTDGEYSAEVKHQEWIEYYETTAEEARLDATLA
jgi:hypothetical protein